MTINTILRRVASTQRRRRRAGLALGLVVWLAAVGLVGQIIADVQRDSRRQLEHRFAIRADSAARFIEIYAQEVIKREQAQAAAQLTKPRVTGRDFDSVVTGGGYQAAVLLDERGRLLQVAPAKPALIGKSIGQDYAHLRSALAGRPAVSRVVPAAATGAAVVGFAAPFDTPQGRRVFSGGFDVKQSPLAAYPIEDCPLAQVSETGVAIHVEEDGFWRKDGSPMAVSCTAAPITLGDARGERRRIPRHHRAKGERAARPPRA